MRFHILTGSDSWKAIVAGLITAVVTASISMLLINSGISPFSAPPALIFAGQFIENPAMPVGFLFHLAYVVAASVIFVSLFRDNMSFLSALGWSVALWVIALVVFFPIIGWGFLGLAQSPQFIVAALVPHALFAVFLWGSCRLLFKNTASDITEKSSSEVIDQQKG